MAKDKKTNSTEQNEIPKGYSKREHIVILIVLVLVIVFGMMYMLAGSSGSENYRDPDANAATVDSIQDNFEMEDVEEKEIREGLPETAKEKKDADEKKADVAADATADAAADAEATATEAATPVAESEPVIKKVAAKKVVEDIKTGPSEEAAISE